MATYHGPSRTPSRRALGDVTPGSINIPSKGFGPSEVARAQSPLKQVTTHFVDQENLENPNAYSKGKKRGIDEVDSAETAENAKMLACGRDESVVSSGARLTTDAVHRHTQNNPIGLADPGSPTERATPSLSPEPGPEPIQVSQKSNPSFSDLLNYDLCASQKSEHGAPFVRMPAPAPIAVEQKKSRAEQLRTRLKFGLYKVKTNQVDKCDADVIGRYEARASYSLDALNASASTAMTSSSDALASHRVLNITISSPRRVQGPVFVRANLDPHRPIQKLGPAPIEFAIPTDNRPASSRMIHLSSSPVKAHFPKSTSPDQLTSPVRQKAHYCMPTEQRTRMGEHDAEEINVREETAHGRLKRMKERIYIERNLSSSGGRGSAAEGLLQLMHDRR